MSMQLTSAVCYNKIDFTTRPVYEFEIDFELFIDKKDEIDNSIRAFAMCVPLTSIRHAPVVSTFPFLHRFVT